MASPFHLSRSRSNSSPQLRCESTVDVSNEPSTSRCPMSEGTCNSHIYTDHEKNWRLETKGVTRASVHWLEPKQRAVHQDEPVEIKPSSASCHTNIDPINEGIQRLSIPDPDMLCCNETIHYLQGSDSDSSLPGTPQMRVRRYRSDRHSRLNKISKAACQILAKFRFRDFHRRRSGSYRQNMLKRMEDDTEWQRQTINRPRLSNVRMLDHSVEDNAASTSAVNEQRDFGSVQQNCHSLHKEPMPKECSEIKKVKKNRRRRTSQQIPLVNFSKFDPKKYPIECTEEIERAAREREIEEGIDRSVKIENESFSQKLSEPSVHVSQISQQNVNAVNEPTTPEATLTTNPSAEISLNAMSHTTENIYDLYGSLTPSGTYIPRTVHTQIDYMHCLVPNQWDIMKSSYYWGKIDRYEADNLLENKPEGTFLLRDSAQEEFLFSVSFCRYGRTLHARIEQWNHKFSFDAHDPGVYSSNTVCGLLEHYKDPNCCMFFEPMLTNPLPRVNPPSLQELGRASICTLVTYDGICYLKLPNGLKEFLREYHYKQRVRIRRVEVNMPQLPQVEQGVITNTCISR